MQDRIKVVIVDDEPQSIHRLQDDLATLEDFEVIATSSSAVSAKTRSCQAPPWADVTTRLAVSRTRLSWRRR